MNAVRSIMAKPDCDDGWIKYAHELDAALACADWSKGARIVLREVFSIIYGRDKPRTAIVRPTDLAGRVGTYKEAIIRGVRELVKGRALVKVGDCEYQFIKDYETWLTSSGKPRLSTQEIAYCKAARTKDASTKRGNETVTASTGVGNETVTPGELDCHPTVTVQFPSHIEDRARVLEEERNEKERERDAGEPNVSQIAERIVREVWHVKDEFEVETQAGTIKHYIGGYSESACLAAAANARRKAKLRDPIPLFLSMCRGGLDDPSQREPNEGGGGMQPARSLSKTERDDIEAAKLVQASIERRKAQAQQEANR
jgi:hypothetical protein